MSRTQRFPEEPGPPMQFITSPKPRLPKVTLLSARTLAALQILIFGTAALLSAQLQAQPTAQSSERWYQIEVTVFSHENSTLNEENWATDAASLRIPENAQPLHSLMDVLDLPDWDAVANPVADTPVDLGATDNNPRSGSGGDPAFDSNFRLPDFDRDAFVALPPSLHNFNDSNRALNNSSAYRVLYHNAWRQPVLQASRATPIKITGGREHDERFELEGSLTIHFNSREDRVVLTPALLFNQFSDGSSNSAIFQTIPVRGSRDMRSNEFHYIDHPVVGIVVQVFPYQFPETATVRIR